MTKFNQQLKFHSISKQAQVDMQAKLDNLSKPIKGLGQLEQLADQLAGIQNTTQLKTKQRTCLVFVADHGVVEEAVSATSQPISNVLSENVAAGHACINALAQRNHCQVKTIDVGLVGNYRSPNLMNQKIQRGTHNMLVEDAMTRDDALKAIQIGYDTAETTIADGCDLLLLGEVGLGNTTASAAIVATMLSLPVDKVVDKGSDISQEKFQHKTQIIKTALARRTPDKTDPVGVLSRVGGFEIGAIVGAMICGAQQGVPVILDGFISDAAALLATALYPELPHYLIASHLSKEQGAKRALQELGLTPLLSLGMAVGEGTGAVISLALIDDIQFVLEHENTLQDLHFEYEN